MGPVNLTGGLLMTSPRPIPGRACEAVSDQLSCRRGVDLIELCPRISEMLLMGVFLHQLRRERMSNRMKPLVLLLIPIRL